MSTLLPCYVLLDLETTGATPTQDRITEIGLICYLRCNNQGNYLPPRDRDLGRCACCWMIPAQPVRLGGFFHAHFLCFPSTSRGPL